MNRMIRLALVQSAFLSLLLAPTIGSAQVEVEPNDAKASANLITLPAANAAGVIVGNSTSASGTGLDYFRVTVPVRATPAFYRHRLIATSSTVGHTLTLRGLNQVAGVPGAIDSTVQTSSTVTTPARYVQWYTSEAGGEIYVRATGVAATTADYSLDYEVQPVAELAGPIFGEATVTITTVGQSAPQTDTDLWVYDANRQAIATFGNDDQFGTTSLGSVLTRDYAGGVYHLAISNFNLANNQPSPADDDFRTGIVMDFPGVFANSSTAVNLNLASLIGGVAQPATKADPYQIVFVRFERTVVDFLFGDGFEEPISAPR